MKGIDRPKKAGTTKRVSMLAEGTPRGDVQENELCLEGFLSATRCGMSQDHGLRMGTGGRDHCRGMVPDGIDSDQKGKDDACGKEVMPTNASSMCLLSIPSSMTERHGKGERKHEP